MATVGTIYTFSSQAGFDPPGEEMKTCVNIVLHLPPKPPRLDFWLGYVYAFFKNALSETSVKRTKKPTFQRQFNRSLKKDNLWDETDGVYVLKTSKKVQGNILLITKEYCECDQPWWLGGRALAS